VAEWLKASGLLNADQHFGHRCFFSQILAFQSLPRTTDLAAVGSGGRVSGAGRDLPDWPGTGLAKSVRMAGGRVLVVDDDADSRMLMAELLTSEGYRVATASNGREALNQLSAETTLRDSPRPRDARDGRAKLPPAATSNARTASFGSSHRV